MYNQKLRAQKELVLSADGTNTLFSKEFNEAYHSTNDGALHESLAKHVKPAFLVKKGVEHLTILDICFGLGYNTFTTLYYIQQNQLNTKVHIISPEFDKELIASLANFDYPPQFDNIGYIIKELSKNFYYEDKQLKIEILLGDARESVPKIKDKIDIIYQDAFSPKQNPLLWTKEFFADIVKISKEDTVLTTYSTAASTRLGLYENGFKLYLNRADGIRTSLIASLKELDMFEPIDMELKKRRNPTAKSLRDRDYLA